MKNKLSYSSVTKYQTCGKAYEFHYIKKLRPNVSSANLFLGSALDTGLNSLLLNDGKDPYEVFSKAWQLGFINKKPIQIKDSLQVVYAKTDFDVEILHPNDKLEIETYYSKLSLPDDYIGNSYDFVFTRKAQGTFIRFTDEEQKLYNFCNWVCLKRKGFLIIDAYKKEVIPRIKRVISVQKQVDFNNDSGDSITGYIDFIAEMDDGKVYVLDNKSAGRPYELDSAAHSPQLALYAHHEGIENAGFIVFIKAIKKDKIRTCIRCGEITDSNRIKTCNKTLGTKRCDGTLDDVIAPRAEIQIILDKINPNLIGMVMENFEMVNTLVQQGIFLKNLNSCQNTYGSRCPYYGQCFNNSNKGLEVVD